MRQFKTALLVVIAAVAAAAQAPDTLISEQRLSVHTLVREDIFAGFRNDNMERVARAERNIEILLKERPDQRANLLAWRGGVAVNRAVRAHEAAHADEFGRQYAAALNDFAEASKLQSETEVGVPAVIGGTMAVFADRLPEKHRAAAWQQAYDNYTKLWKLQGAAIDKLPVHHKGEVLAGLAQAAQRTGRSEESAQHLDRMLTVMAGTPYEPLAKEWKSNPSAAASTNLTCRNCHAPGRLANRLEALK